MRLVVSVYLVCIRILHGGKLLKWLMGRQTILIPKGNDQKRLRDLPQIYPITVCLITVI